MKTTLITHREQKNAFFVGQGIEKSEVTITHKQRKSETNGNKRNRIEDKKNHQFNLCTSFEKRDARKLKRKLRNEFMRSLNK
jgi:F0F1-type ATP synthase epsilon subunit